MQASSLHPGDVVEISRVEGPAAVVDRLKELGLAAGVQVVVLYRTLLGSTLAIEVLGQVIALGREEAACIHFSGEKTA